MLVTNQINSAQTSTKSVTQKQESNTDFSAVLNETLQSPAVNISSLELKIGTFSDEQIAQAIPLEVYLDRMNPSATGHTQNHTYATMNTTQNISSLNNIDLFSTNQYDSIIIAESKKNGLDPLIVKSIIKHESGFNTNAVSSAGASGLMQLMPSNVRHFGVSDPFNASENIAAGTKLFKQCCDMYDGDLTLALAAYNAGPGNVKKYGGVPPFNETQNYIKRVLGTYEKATGL